MADTGTILLAGASRGLGLGLASAYLEQGWAVVATARDPAAATGLTALAADHGDRLRVEKLDITSADDGRALAQALAGTKLDVIFVVAGMHIEQDTPIADVKPESVALEFLTNAVGPVALAEPLRVHAGPDGKRRPASDINERLQTLMALVGLRTDHLSRYPHEFSGGQRQRIGIARALALEPDLIVADEPVSALDVSVQAQVVNLLMDLQERLSLTYVFIAHDLAVVRQIATRTAVMYLGAVVEIGQTQDMFARPAHPYTAALLAAVPGRGTTRARIAGEVPSPWNPPPGCRFHPRCPKAASICREERPLLRPVASDRLAACHFPF